MTLDELTNKRQTALAHLNTCRRLRDAVRADISAANQHGEQVAPETLDLYEYLTDTETAALRAYTSACSTVDAEQNRRAGLTNPEPQP